MEGSKSKSIGQHFIVGFSGQKLPQWLYQLEEKFGLGGVILFDYDVKTKKDDNNIASPQQLKWLCQEIKELSSSPHIFIDQEGGLVRRLKEKKGFSPLPSAQKFNSLTRSEKKQSLFHSFHEMKNLGIDYNLAPVIDINYNPSNPNIGAIERSFSRSSQEVEDNLLLINEVAKSVDLKLCLKHYPGLGGATTNSHLDITDLSGTVTQDQLHLFYKYGSIIHGQSILISHGFVREWDHQNPCTVSRPILSKLKEHSPHAQLISDDMQMEGLLKICGSIESACEKSLQAGMDMICIGNNLKDHSAKLWDMFSRLEHS